VDRAQNSPRSDVRLAAGARISSTRSGGIVTLKGTSLLYSVSTETYFKRPAVVFQFREIGSTTWGAGKDRVTSPKRADHR
jgi:hypothetical protein